MAVALALEISLSVFWYCWWVPPAITYLQQLQAAMPSFMAMYYRL